MRGEVGIRLELKQGMGPHLNRSWETQGSSDLWWETRVSFRVVTGSLGPLELHEVA